MKTKQTDVDVVAINLAKCYQFERNEWMRCWTQPGDYRIPRCWSARRQGNAEARGKSVWHKLAQFCTQRQIFAMHYIQWCVWNTFPNVHAAPPEPNQLLTSKRMDAYVAYRPRRKMGIQIELGIQMRLARSTYVTELSRSATVRQAWANVLLSNLEISPLLRYCLATRLGDEYDNIAEYYEQAALLQFSRDPDLYGEVWPDADPGRHAGKAAWFYQRVVEKQP